MNQFRSSAGVPAVIRRRIQRLVRGLVPRLADFSLAYVAEGVAVTCVASAHVTRDGDRLLRTLARLHRITPSDTVSSVAQVFRTGRSLLRRTIRAERRAATNDNRVAELHRLLGPRSALVVPIVSGATVFGAISLCYAESGRAYTLRDVPDAANVATKIARLLTATALPHGTLRLRAAARDPRQGTTLRRRVVSRN